MWKQCHALVHEKGLPAELWEVVKDLWTLWLSRLEGKLQGGARDIANDDIEADALQSEDVKSTTGSESGKDGNEHAKVSSEDRKRNQHDYPKLIDTVVLLHVGIIMLRRPLRLAQMLE
jgi:RNA polymerase I-specific transcription initiation factor RRN7